MTAPVSPIILAARNALEVLFTLKGREITLKPATAQRTKKPSGGYDYNPDPLRDPQVFALGKIGGFDGRERSNNDQGLSRKQHYLLTGRWNCEVEIGDAWDDDEADYVVETTDTSSGYKTVCDVIGYLKDVSHGPI